MLLPTIAEGKTAGKREERKTDNRAQGGENMEFNGGGYVNYNPESKKSSRGHRGISSGHQQE